MKQTVITGSTGFLGQMVVQGLRQNELHLRLFDRSVHSLSDPSSLQTLLEGADVIIHLAAVTKVDDSTLMETNVVGAANLLDAVQHYAPDAHIVFASSFGVYQPTEEHQAITEDHPLVPRNAYGLSKLIDEKLLQWLAEKGRINKVTILRIANIYGPEINGRSNALVNMFLQKIKDHQLLTINGDGEQTRDFFYGEDFVDLLKKIIDHPANDKCTIINVCSGEATSLNQLLQVCQTVTGLQAEVTYRSGALEKDYWQGSFQRAKQLFDWQPTTSLEQGITKVWQAMQG